MAKISTASELAEFAALVNGGCPFKGKTITLAADINLDNIPWTPIGTPSTPFDGIFDGKGHMIKGLCIKGKKDSFCQGLFGLNYGIIKNLGLEAQLIKGGCYVGVLAGVNGRLISDCYAIGNVAGNASVGVLAGSNSDGTIQRCYAMGKVSGTKEIGGLTGASLGYSDGGIICECYAAVAVKGKDWAGGLVGLSKDASISHSYYDTEISGHSDKKGKGKTTVQMRSKKTFARWNFVDSWSISKDFNNGMPHLHWQKVK